MTKTTTKGQTLTIEATGTLITARLDRQHLGSGPAHISAAEGTWPEGITHMVVTGGTRLGLTEEEAVILQAEINEAQAVAAAAPHKPAPGGAGKGYPYTQEEAYPHERDRLVGPRPDWYATRNGPGRDELDNQ